MPTPSHKMHGITLIELMVAVMIFGLLMAVGYPSFTSWIQNAQTRNAAESILNGMQVARGEAVKRNVSTMFILCDLGGGGTGSSWDVLAASAPANSVACGANATGATGWERVQMRLALEGSQNAVVAATGAPGVNAVAFNGFGRVFPVANPSLPPAAFGIIQPITQVDISNPRGNKALRVTIPTGGALRMCDPAMASTTDPRHC